MEALISSSGLVSLVMVSKGRPDILGETLDSLRRQTLRPEKIVVVVPSPQDLPVNASGDRIETIVGPLGTCVQRNAGIKAISESVAYIGFFDDDFEPCDDYLERAVEFMEAHPDVVGISGVDLSGESTVTRDQAQRMIAEFHPEPADLAKFIGQGKHFILHGCNMVIRHSVLRQELFDDNLPLYSYGEDYEISIRLLRHGRIGRFHGCVGVHLQVVTGRIREVQRSYSEIANNWYFLRKGTVHLPPFRAWVRFVWICSTRPIFVDLWSLLRRDRNRDWAGRLKGHLLAVADIFRGRSSPQRIRDL